MKQGALLFIVLAMCAGAGSQTIKPSQVRGLPIYSAEYSSLASIESACGASHCHVVVTTPQTFTLSADHTIPSNIDLSFRNGGEWTINGAFTLTVGSGNVDAAFSQIFAGSAAVTGLKVSRPEWLGPTATVGAAIAALSSIGGDVYLQCTTYRSGQDKYSPTDYSNVDYLQKQNVHIHGCQRPAYGPGFTQMAGGTGTIIQGGFYVGASGFQISDLGVDAGSVVQGLYYTGYTALDSLVITGKKPGDESFHPYLTGIKVTNVNCLGPNSTSPDHCMLVEDVEEADVHNVQTVFHEFGLVLKGINSTLDSVDARGSSNSGVLVKGDTYAPTSSDTVSNVRVSSAVDHGDGGGVQVFASSYHVQNVEFSNITVSDTTYGFEFNSDPFGTNTGLSGVSLSSFTYNGLTVAGPCINATNTGRIEYVSISNFQCLNSNYAYIATNPVAQQALSNGVITSTTQDAIYLTTSANISNISLAAIPGYDINNTGTDTAYVSNIVKSGTPNFNGPVTITDQTQSTAPFTFLNGWHNNDGSVNSIGSYSLNSTQVKLSGLIVYGGSSAVVTTLPAGYRPVDSKRLAAIGYNGSSFLTCEVLIETSGNISVTNASTCATTYVSLDGLSFSTVNP